MAMAVLLAVMASVAATIDCAGGPCNGTNGNDTLSGPLGFDEINGKGRNDDVFGRAGNGRSIRGKGFVSRDHSEDNSSSAPPVTR